MKKTVFLLAAALAACASVADAPPEPLKITVTSFPIYDWVREVAGRDDIVLLQQSGADLHNFSPTSDDILAIAKCKLFIYVGGESDENWVDRVLEQNPNSNRTVINLLNVLGDNAKIEEPVEGEEHEHEHEEEYDEHVWLSLKNAGIFVDEIVKALVKIDNSNAETYTQNAIGYKAKLSALDDKYTAAVNNAGTKTLLFADRFPFRYLVDDYGLSYFAAYSGCSAANSAASPETIVRLADKLIENSLTTVLKLEDSDGSIARQVIETAKNKGYMAQVEIKTLDSLQASTIREYNAGRNYLAVMESNLDVLKIALKVAE